MRGPRLDRGRILRVTLHQWAVVLRMVGTMALFVAMYALLGWWGVVAAWGWKMQESLRGEGG